MRSILLLFAGAAIVSASRTNCAQNDIHELVSRTTCGCPKSITACVGRNVDLESFEEVEQCFVGGGCSEAEATEQAVLFAQRCHSETVAEDRDDLRKRADNPKTDKAKTTSADAQTTSADAQTTNADATTTSDSSSASPASPSTTAVPPSTTSDSSSSTDSSTSTTSTGSTTITSASATPTGPVGCYVTSIKSTSACSISAGTTVTCIPTTTAIQSCAPGLLCFSPTAGASSCMKKQDNLTTSGLVVTIVFAGGIGAALLAWAILCLQSRNRNKRQEALMMGSRGKGLDTEYASPFAGGRNQAMRSDANLPLIAPGGIRSDQQSYGQQEGYFEHGPEGSAVPPVPKIQIHPGLGALGQENRRL